MNFFPKTGSYLGLLHQQCEHHSEKKKYIYIYIARSPNMDFRECRRPHLGRKGDTQHSQITDLSKKRLGNVLPGSRQKQGGGQNSKVINEPTTAAETFYSSIREDENLSTQGEVLAPAASAPPGGL